MPSFQDLINKDTKKFFNNTKKARGNSKSNTKRETVYSIDKDKILMRQKGLCAGKNCKKLHNGKRIPINIRNHFDHVIPLKLKGKDDIFNIQGLCANCHQLKTREDRKLISQKKKKLTSSQNNIFNPLGNQKKVRSLFDIP